MLCRRAGSRALAEQNELQLFMQPKPLLHRQQARSPQTLGSGRRRKRRRRRRRLLELTITSRGPSNPSPAPSSRGQGRHGSAMLIILQVWCRGLGAVGPCHARVFHAATGVVDGAALHAVHGMSPGGFANSVLLRQRSSIAVGEAEEEEEEEEEEGREGEQTQAVLQVRSEQDDDLRADLVGRAAAVRDIMGAALDRGITLREILKGGVLAGQPVFFQSRHGQILLTGERLAGLPPRTEQE
jgi:hypothetical protein